MSALVPAHQVVGVIVITVVCHQDVFQAGNAYLSQPCVFKAGEGMCVWCVDT